MTKNTDTDDILDTPEDEFQEAEATIVEPAEDTSVLSSDASEERSNTKTQKKCFLSNISLDNWVIICSLLGIAFQFLAVMLIGISSSYVVYQVFAYLGYIAVIASATIYVVQMIRSRVVAFTPQLVLLILSVLMTSPLGIY